MRCCTATKEGSRKMCVWCKFQDVFSTTWPHGLISKRGVLGSGGECLRFVIAFTGDSTSSTRWVKTETQLVVSLPTALPLFLCSPYLTLSLCCFASFIMLIRFACQHTQLSEDREGLGKERRNDGGSDDDGARMDHCYFGMFMVCTPHTHTDTTAETGNILDTVFKFN